MDEAEVQDEFGRALVELVRDPVVGTFLHGEAVPEPAASVEDTMLVLAPRVLGATIDRWVEVTGSGEFPVQVWCTSEWLDPASTPEAQAVLMAALTEAVDVPEYLRDFGRPVQPPPPRIPTVSVPRRWRDALAAPQLADALTLSVPDMVDSVVASVLDALDDGRARLRFRDPSGQSWDMSCPNGIGGGELLGWYYGTDGWLDRFAHEVVHPIADFSGLLDGLLDGR